MSNRHTLSQFMSPPAPAVLSMHAMLDGRLTNNAKTATSLVVLQYFELFTREIIYYTNRIVVAIRQV